MNKHFSEMVLALPEWHPLKTYYKENRKLSLLLEELSNCKIKNEFKKFLDLFNQVNEVKIHYQRKDRLIFPLMDKYGLQGANWGMLTFQDANQLLLAYLKRKIDSGDFDSIDEDIKITLEELSRMIVSEETHYFPKTLEVFSEEDWKRVRMEENRIGWAFKIIPG